MKVTKSYIKQLAREELSKLLNEESSAVSSQEAKQAEKIADNPEKYDVDDLFRAMDQDPEIQKMVSKIVGDNEKIYEAVQDEWNPQTTGAPYGRHRGGEGAGYAGMFAGGALALAQHPLFNALVAKATALGGGPAGVAAAGGMMAAPIVLGYLIDRYRDYKAGPKSPNLPQPSIGDTAKDFVGIKR